MYFAYSPMTYQKMRARWLFVSLVMGLVLVAVGLGWSRYRRHADPMAEGLEAYSKGDWESAADQARIHLKVVSEDLEGLRLLARASIRLGRYPSAMSIYQRIGPPAMKAEDLCLLGVALARTGKTQAARDVWERARSLEPGHAETLFELSRSYLAGDAFDHAARLGGLLATRPGWESRAEALLGMVAFERNDFSGAATYWQKALSRPDIHIEGVPSPIVPRGELIRALLRAGRTAEARDQVRIMADESPGPESAWLLSRVALQEGAWDEFRSAFVKGSVFREENPQLADPSPFVGNARCAECHPNEAKTQQNSRHARTFFRSSELDGLSLPAKAVPDRSDPKVLHTLTRTSEKNLKMETQVDGEVYDAVVQYAFGSGDRGLTLIGRDAKKRPLELRISEYRDSQGLSWDVTTGHPRNPSRGREFLGQPLDEDGIRRCLVCHVTDTQSVLAQSGACSMDRGIGCEKCHGPASNHLKAVEGHLIEIDPAIGRPSLTSGMRVVKICAACHSPRGQEVLRDDPMAVRFQGSTLTWSRCFTESNDTFDCITCHDPHRNVSTSHAYYESKCLSCHSATGTTKSDGQSAVSPDRPRARSKSGGLAEKGAGHTTCPVNPTSGCVGCHMPAVKDVAPHALFTDHYIRVHRD